MSAYRILGPGAERRRPAWSVAWATAFCFWRAERGFFAFGVQSATGREIDGRETLTNRFPEIQ
jgi:hypothetical protein